MKKSIGDNPLLLFVFGIIGASIICAAVILVLHRTEKPQPGPIVSPQKTAAGALTSSSPATANVEEQESSVSSASKWSFRLPTLLVPSGTIMGSDIDFSKPFPLRAPLTSLPKGRSKMPPPPTTAEFNAAVERQKDIDPSGMPLDTNPASSNIPRRFQANPLPSWRNGIRREDEAIKPQVNL